MGHRRRCVTALHWAALLSAALLVGTVTPVSAAQASDVCVDYGTKYEPADGQVIHIIGQDTESIAEYVDATGIVPAAVMSYSNIALPVGLYTPWEFGSGEQYASRLIEQYPNSAIQLAITMQGSLDAVNLGALDANILLIADYVKGAGVPFFIRLGYEFDLPQNGYAAAQYAAAYRHVVDKFREHGVTNVSWVWHGHGYSQDEGHLLSYYPGDAYVDWVAISFFEHSWTDPALPGPNAWADFAAAHDKPMMIAESTPRGLGVHHGQESWDSWFAPLFSFVNARGIKALSYINVDWEALGAWPGWGDARVQANPYVFDQWMQVVGQPHYLKASPTLFCDMPTTLALQAPNTAHSTDPMELAATLTSSAGTLAGQSVTISVGDRQESAVTDESGIARITANLDVDPGTVTVTADFAGVQGHAPSSATPVQVQVLADPTSVIYTGQTRGVGEVIQASAVLAEDDDAPLAGESVLFTAGQESVVAVTDATGRAEAALTVADHSRTEHVQVEYQGTTRYAPSATSATVSWGGRPNR